MKSRTEVVLMFQAVVFFAFLVVFGMWWIEHSGYLRGLAECAWR